MKPVLPQFLDRYLAAQDAHDIEAIEACFAPDAVVRDEGRDIVGTQAIQSWKIETDPRYSITAEPLKSRPEAGRTLVVVKISGTFPGSPAQPTYRFGFSADGRTNALEVR
jgi:hypothetical protein